MPSIWKQSVVIPVPKKRRSKGALERAMQGPDLNFDASGTSADGNEKKWDDGSLY